MLFNSQINPETIYLEDDGIIPNSVLPLLVYTRAFAMDVTAGQVELRFAENDWSNSWRNGIFPYHHYHSISHEVLGCYNGSAIVQMGGESGTVLKIGKGDVLVIPAGVGHKLIQEFDDFHVVGAYPGGANYDVLKAEKANRPKADANIAKIPIPGKDPVTGARGGLNVLWRD